MIATYGTDFYAGTPVITRKQNGNGSAWHVASSPDARFLQDLIKQLCTEASIRPVLENLPAGIEAMCRSKDGKNFIFLLNHTDSEIKIELGDKKLHDLLTEQTFSSDLMLAGRGVVIGEEV